MLHVRVSCKYGHAYPPATTAVVTLRDRDCAPLPHDLVHVVQALKADTTQCDAHECVLQARCSSRYGQA